MEKDSSSYKIPPHNLEAEQAVLGAILTDNGCFQKVKAILGENPFYSGAHQRIFSAIVSMIENRQVVDLITLADRLRQEKRIEEVGGTAYISSLVDNCLSSLMAEHYARIVKEKYLLRRAITGAYEISEAAYGGQEKPDGIMTMIQELLAGLSKQSTEESGRKLDLSLEALQDYFANCRETPFKSLNVALGGLFGGQLIIVGARGGMGKTALTHTLLRHTSFQENRPSMYFGAEMSREIIFARLLSPMSRVPYNTIRTKRANIEQAQALMAAHKRILEAQFSEYVIRNKISAVSIMELVRRFQDEIKTEIGLVAVENLDQIIWPTERFRKDGRFRKDETDMILSSLRSFGLEMKIPIIISVQINRDAEDRENRRPELSELKGTGNAEQIVDVVLFPFRPDYYGRSRFSAASSESAELIIAKGGPPMTIPMKFFGDFLSWEESDTQ